MTDRSQSVVVAGGVTKRYAEASALNEVSLELGEGEVVAVLGPNGAGKSTLIDLMLGLRRPSSGSIRVLGGTPTAAVTRGRVGAVLQAGTLPAGARVREVVVLACQLYGRVQDPDEVVAVTGLSGLESRRVEKLSGGQAQRVRFGIALAGRPQILFLDEPSVGLDVEARREFWTAVRGEADRGATVIFATHYLDEVDAHAQRVVVLNHGRVVADGTPEDIKRGVAASTVTATLPGARIPNLADLPGVIEVRDVEQRFQLRTTDSDATVAGLYARGYRPISLRISTAGLDEALVALTEQGAPA